MRGLRAYLLAVVLSSEPARGQLSCVVNPDNRTVVDFSNATLVHSNLGGVGPDNGTESLRFAGVGTKANGRAIDLEIVTLSSYASYRNLQNKQREKFGQVNLLGSMTTTASVELQYTFLDEVSSQPETLDAFQFTLYDFDFGVDGNGVECVSIAGYDQYYLTSSTEVTVSADTAGTGAMLFCATTRGYGSDNPSDPHSPHGSCRLT